MCNWSLLYFFFTIKLHIYRMITFLNRMIINSGPVPTFFFTLYPPLLNGLLLVNKGYVDHLHEKSLYQTVQQCIWISIPTPKYVCSLALSQALTVPQPSGYKRFLCSKRCMDMNKRKTQKQQVERQHCNII